MLSLWHCAEAFMDVERVVNRVWSKLNSGVMKTLKAPLCAAPGEVWDFVEKCVPRVFKCCAPLERAICCDNKARNVGVLCVLITASFKIPPWLFSPRLEKKFNLTKMLEGKSC
jgi:hypothetical protein